MVNEVFQDQNGSISSKRVCGIICLGIGAGFLIAAGVASFFILLPGVSTIIQIGTIFLGIGGGLLGIGVVEFFAPKNNIDGK